MTQYIEYQIDNTTTILIESQDEIAPKTLGATSNSVTTKAKMNFSEALKSIKVQSKYLISEIEDLHVDEAEIKFAINTIGEIGNMAIGKVGVGANYEVTLKWKKKSQTNKKKNRSK